MVRGMTRTNRLAMFAKESPESRVCMNTTKILQKEKIPNIKAGMKKKEEDLNFFRYIFEIKSDKNQTTDTRTSDITASIIKRTIKSRIIVKCPMPLLENPTAWIDTRHRAREREFEIRDGQPRLSGGA